MSIKIDIATIVAVIGVLMAIATVFGAFKVSRNTQATTLYRENALAWEGKAKIQESDITELKEKIASRDRKIAELEATVSVLRDTVTGKAVLDELARQIGSIVTVQDDILSVIRSNQAKIDDIHARMNLYGESEAKSDFRDRRQADEYHHGRSQAKMDCYNIYVGNYVCIYCN